MATSTPRTDKPPICRPPGGADDGGGDPFGDWPAPRPTRRALLHWTFLILAIIVITGSILMRVENGTQVIVPLIDKPLPGTCTFLRITGLPCPGCGLTRSFISFAHGHWAESWRYNPAGVFFFAVVAFQIPYRALQIARLRRGMEEHRFSALDTWAIVFLVLVLVSQWGIGVLTRLM